MLGATFACSAWLSRSIPARLPADLESFPRELNASRVFRVNHIGRSNFCIASRAMRVRSTVELNTR
jgi:hypothetical protein